MAAIKPIKSCFSLLGLVFLTINLSAQALDSTEVVYKKRVLETTEVDFLSSFYTQDGENAAVTGGVGTESLQDVTGTIIISIPLNDDDILTIDGGVSAYTSASSSNINPFDKGTPDSYQASTGASSSDVWTNGNFAYTHSSDDRNTIWSGKMSFSNEFDYSSFGFGGSIAKLFNEKNTELSLHSSVYLDNWRPIYPYELRPVLVQNLNKYYPLAYIFPITGNKNYQPNMTEFSNTNRNSYAIGLGFSQILHKKVQGSLALDYVQQEGLLSTPFQRVYFADIANSYAEGFHLADDIERLPNKRTKIALGGRLSWYINEKVVLRNFLRYYQDDWGIISTTAQIELPIKITDQFTIYPSYRYYTQSAADYFAPYEKHLSTESYYTSDYDLSAYSANQFGFGIGYVDPFSSHKIAMFGLKSIDVKFYQYHRNTTFKSSLITLGVKFVMD